MQPLNQIKWADHLRGCAQITNDITRILDIRDDSARQATFATVCIDATKHNIFVEPIPESKTPVIQPETAAVESRVPEKGVDLDKAAAEKADAQINDVPKTTTVEESDGARRVTFLKAVESARLLLNKEGHQPPITPIALNAVVKHDFAPKTQVGTLDTEELERLMMLLNSKLEVLREKNAKTQTDEEVDF